MRLTGVLLITFLTVAQFQFRAGLMGGQLGRIAVVASLRYTGGFYETPVGTSRARAYVAHASILSEGYAPLLPNEPIGY